MTILTCQYSCEIRISLDIINRYKLSYKIKYRKVDKKDKQKTGQNFHLLQLTAGISLAISKVLIHNYYSPFSG